MLKRHSIDSFPVTAQHRVAIICLLTLIVGSQHVSAQSQLAQDAYAIFEGSCLICHGSDGAYRETLLMEHDALIGGGTVVPGNPNASELYKRLLGPTESGAQMPFGQPPLPPQSIDTIRRWILAGAPDWATIPTPDSRFISPVKYSRALRRTSTHFQRLTERLPATSHLPICITQGKLRSYLVSTAKHSINWLTASHGDLMSSTQSQSTRKPLSSTSTSDTTNGMSMTPGAR